MQIEYVVITTRRSTSSAYGHGSAVTFQVLAKLAQEAVITYTSPVAQSP